MTVSASQIFDFLDAHPAFDATRHEMSNAIFSVFRRNLRMIALGLFEADTPDALEAANAFRRVLSENLTVPIPFDHTMLDSVELLGDAESMGDRWGAGVRDAFDLARRAAQDLQKVESPVRRTLREIIAEQSAQSRSFRIICHRGARSHFESLFPSEGQLLGPNSFIHSLQDFRNAPIFDVLIKMGPLRSRGWGAVPDAVLSAPRYGKLEQVVWAGCRDEEDFGYDPAGRSDSATGTPDPQSGLGRNWSFRVLPPDGDDLEGHYASPDLDDLGLMMAARKVDRESTRAILVQIDSGHGILYPPLAQVISIALSADDSSAIAGRLPGETLEAGMLLIIPTLADADLGGPHADEGHYSRQWKSRLIQEASANPTKLIRSLKEAGIDLKLIGSAVRHWSYPASTVIHAPQQRKHFEALIRVLGLDQQQAAGGSRAPWWQHAWYEIAASRGEAIQSGMYGHELVEEELKKILGRMLPEIRVAAQSGNTFQFEIPAGTALAGRLKFYRVHSIEDGFRVPGQSLRTISELSAVEQWRN
jgi:hypothetical protein